MIPEAALAALGERLKDREWRLSNLYWIVDKEGRAVRFTPNWAQLLVFAKLGRRNIDLKVRQLGMTTGYCILWLDSILFSKDLKVGIVAHTKGDAQVIFRDKILYAYDRLPEEIKAAVPVTKRDGGELALENGSGIRVSVSFRSGTPQILHITELGYIASRMPARAEEIKTGALQAVPKDGIVVIESTAKGRAGLFYDLVSEAQKRIAGPYDYALNFLPWWREPGYQLPDTGTFAQTAEEKEYLDDLEVKAGTKITRDQREWYCRKWRELGDDRYAEYPSTAEEAFRQSTEGAYYGKQMLDAWRSGRITEVPIEPGLPVETWWDIGVNDSTAIWFVQRFGLEIRVVDYYANSGEGLPHYADYLTKWQEQHGARVGRAIGPHDLRVKEWGGAETRLARAEKLGINFEIAPELSVADGIEAVRNVLPRCVFDETRCAAGIKALESYRKEWDAALGVWKNQPLHDWASDPADSFRYGALSMSKAPAQIGQASRSAARKVVAVRWK